MCIGRDRMQTAVLAECSAESATEKRLQQSLQIPTSWLDCKSLGAWYVNLHDQTKSKRQQKFIDSCTHWTAHSQDPSVESYLVAWKTTFLTERCQCSHPPTVVRSTMQAPAMLSCLWSILVTILGASDCEDHTRPNLAVGNRFKMIPDRREAYTSLTRTTTSQDTLPSLMNDLTVVWTSDLAVPTSEPLFWASRAIPFRIWPF
jgi:hypothetical protein